MTRMISTARREYGFSAARSTGPGGRDVLPGRLLATSYRNAWWIRMRCQRAAALSVVRGRREPAHQLLDGRLDLAPEEEPAVARQGIADVAGSWPTIPKST